MKLLKKITITLLATVTCVVALNSSVFADGKGMPSREAKYLNEMMTRQLNENLKIQEYIKLQDAKSKIEKRPVSDIEMTKRQALEGIAQGNNLLLDMGATTIGCGENDGMYNVAFLDQQAYEGFVSGMAALEKVKQDTWMQYTFRTH